MPAPNSKTDLSEIRQQTDRVERLQDWQKLLRDEYEGRSLQDQFVQEVWDMLDSEEKKQRFRDYLKNPGVVDLVSQVWSLSSLEVSSQLLT